MARWIVVGGGAAGCVIAGRISAERGHDVVLIEAGDDHGEGSPPDDRGPYLSDPSRLAQYRVRRRPGGPLVDYTVGRGLGGSSLVNGSIVVAGGPGSTGKGHAVPLVAATEAGPLGPVGRALLSADDRAEPVLLARRGGVRVTAADAYVRPNRDRPNLSVVTATPVDRIVLDGRRAVGVRTAGGTDVAGDRVVVCGGAIGTPVLLLRSGVDTPGVGDHLDDHPAVAFTLDLDRQVRRAAHDITVSLTGHGRQIVALERTGPDSPHGALIAGLTATSGRGRVALDDDGQPVVDLGQLTVERDRAELAAVAAEAIGLLDHRAFRAVVSGVWADDRGTPLSAVDRRDLDRWVVDRLGGFHHVAGTCRRGLVTDAGGWVRGYDGLAVADASLFDEAPPVNIYLATILQAERLARRWLGAGG